MSMMAKLTQKWGNNIDSMRDIIIENVCSLISCRAPFWEEKLKTGHLKGTIVHYGIRHATRSQSKANIEVILADITEVIQLYEPRLQHVLIEPSKDEKLTNNLKFRISAVLDTELGSETMVFDSVLDFSFNQLDIRNSNLV
ncbi:type VI secretion system baseplate subunit TssE [Parashewanella curva]|uniref:Type VI secretion system baseplate subunit TssE n=1 Tax=Parashewanella curva TaxID=2338552 RepID=A0A3L8Q3H6_9GAMM|nr:type VI secretion system baseplate subunit TssE [Parashewanella curva]RLV61242.1 type VI secretion system baseplate subunit TssE [Parashewanella curva]